MSIYPIFYCNCLICIIINIYIFAIFSFIGFNYKINGPFVYNKASEGGIRFNDPDIGVDWKINPDEAILSEKDKNAPFLKEVTCF